MELLKGGLRNNLRNGQSISMFNDPWLPRPSTFKVVSPCDLTMKDSTVAEFITPSLQWDVQKLNQFLVDFDVEIIKRLPISGSAPDNWI